MEVATPGRPAIRLRPSILKEECFSSNDLSSAWIADSLQDSYLWNTSQEPLIDLTLPVPRSRFVEVPHVRQSYSWDCGLACVLMVLNAVGVKGCDLKFLGHLCGTTSIWTVDLAHLLRYFAVDVAFLTVTVGANPNYAGETFYKENLEADGERVNRLFEKSAQAGIQIVWRTVPGEELSMLILSGRYLAIALVDKRKMSYPWLQELCMGDCCGLVTGYVGHYVVICGYDMDSNEFEIRDPGTYSGSRRISLEALHIARTSFGTDEDLLLVNQSMIATEEGPFQLATAVRRLSALLV